VNSRFTRYLSEASPIGPAPEPIRAAGMLGGPIGTAPFLQGHSEFKWVGQRYLYHRRGMFWPGVDDLKKAPSEAEREFGFFTRVAGVKVQSFCWELGTEMQKEIFVVHVLEMMRRSPDNARGPIRSLFRLLEMDVLVRIFGVTLRVGQ
jgi:hypothetical protein